MLNDNGKSISDNVGALHDYLGRVRTDSSYASLRDAADRLAGPRARRPARQGVAERTMRSAKEFWLPSKTSVIFEELGFTYLGPFDGHDTQRMIEIFARRRTSTARC